MSTDVVYKSRLTPRFNIPSMDDLPKWDESWEQVLGDISSKEVFEVLKDTWKRDQKGPSAPSDDPSKRIRSRVLRSQEMASKLLHELEARDFTFVWALMNDDKLKSHYFNGLKEACAHSSLHEDARGLCPEITIEMMLERLDYKFFLNNFSEAVKRAGEGNLALLRSDWWTDAVTITEPWPEDVKLAFSQLTLQRNEFITAFILHSMLSIVRDLNFTSPMADLLKSKSLFSSSAWSYTSKVTTPIRCTYCTGSADELGKELLFLVCGRCKSKANNPVSYCSRPCQLADWSKHKLDCGKIKPPPPSGASDLEWDHFTIERTERSQDFERNNVTCSPKSMNPERQFTPELERQVALLKAHPDADYFFFDDEDNPIPFVLISSDQLLNLNFHNFQEECMFGRELKGLDAIAEYMIKNMAKKPGLSAARILNQLSKEYSVDVTQLVVKLQGRKVDNGYNAEKSFLEEMGNDILKGLLSPEFE